MMYDLAAKVNVFEFNTKTNYLKNGNNLNPICIILNIRRLKTKFLKASEKVPKIFIL